VFVGIGYVETCRGAIALRDRLNLPHGIHAVVNIDMVGAKDDPTVLIGHSESKSLETAINDVIRGRQLEVEVLGPSDELSYAEQFVFRLLGVPALILSSSQPSTWRTPGDDPSTVDPSGVLDAADVGYGLVHRLAVSDDLEVEGESGDPGLG